MTFLEGIKMIQAEQNKIFRHANYDPIELTMKRGQYWKIKPGASYESISLTYQPLTLNSRSKDMPDIKYKSFWYTNGGTLIVTDEEYVVKYLFHTVVRFQKDKTLAERIPDMMLSKGLLLTDGNQSIRMYFFPKEAEWLYETLGV